MLRLASYDIVFQEIPGEITLALNISGCPNACPGCHSPHLQREVGEKFDEELLIKLLDRYGSSVTCVCFMGGDGRWEEVVELAAKVKELSYGRILIGWYSGRQSLPGTFDTTHFDYIKLGPYIEKLGGLKSSASNQRFYKIEEGFLLDSSEVFR